MRRDSEIFLKKCLQYREKIGKDAFEIDINYFSEIPNIEVEIDEIIEELKKCNCISRKSEHVGENIQIYIILDGITYFNDYKGNEQRIAININGDQINIATDNGMVDAKKYEKYTRNALKTIAVEERNERATSSGESLDQLFWLSLVVLIILMKFYLDHYLVVQASLVIASLIIGMATFFVYYNSGKNRVIYAKNIKKMSYFNMIGILFIPLLIVIINLPIYTSLIDLDALKQRVDMKGMVEVLLNSKYSLYALFQVMGMLLLILFMIQIVCSDVYIFAVTNIAIGRKAQWFWKILFKLTYKRGRDWKIYVKVGILILVMSILCIMGVIPYIIEKLSNMTVNDFSKI